LNGCSVKWESVAQDAVVGGILGKLIPGARMWALQQVEVMQMLFIDKWLQNLRLDKFLKLLLERCC